MSLGLSPLGLVSIGLAPDEPAAGGITGAIAWTEDDDVCAISGTVINLGALSWTEQDDVTVIEAQTRALAALSWTEQDDTTSITGVVLQPVSGALAWTEDDDTTEATGIGGDTSTGGHGFEMVSLEPTWRRMLRLRTEAKVKLERKARKRAELIEKIAAKEAMSTKPEPQIEARVRSLLAEWIALAPVLEVPE